MKKHLLVKTLIALVAVVFIMACTKDDDLSNTNTNNGNNSTDTTDANNTNNIDTAATTLEYPTTYIVVDSDTMWMVSNTKLSDPYKYRYQINFGTKAQLQQNVEEVGQNSTIGFVMSFTEKPDVSGVFNFTSSRMPATDTLVNFYISFFNNTGYSIVNKNYLSPDVGELNISISGANLSSSFGPMTITDEVDANQSLVLNGFFDFEW